MPKLIWLYEDIVNESGEKSENPRYKLIGKKYFSGIYKGSRCNDELWTIVGKYIDTVYDTEYLAQVYIASDEEGKEEVWQALNRADKDALKVVYKRLLDVTKE